MSWCTISWFLFNYMVSCHEPNEALNEAYCSCKFWLKIPDNFTIWIVFELIESAVDEGIRWSWFKTNFFLFLGSRSQVLLSNKYIRKGRLSTRCLLVPSFCFMWILAKDSLNVIHCNWALKYIWLSKVLPINWCVNHSLLYLNLQCNSNLWPIFVCVSLSFSSSL